MRRLAAAALLLALCATADAKSSRELPYAAARVWPAALRFLRVDAHMTITEKDPDAGYILFELSDGKRTFAGSAELIAFTDSRGRPSTRVFIGLKDRPSYMEEGLLERFEVKLREELGAPPPPPPPKEDKEIKDKDSKDKDAGP